MVKLLIEPAGGCLRKEVLRQGSVPRLGAKLTSSCSIRLTLEQGFSSEVTLNGMNFYRCIICILDNTDLSRCLIK